jgi:hypothetical protein
VADSYSIAVEAALRRLPARGHTLLPYAEKLKIISEKTLVAAPSALGENVGQLAEIATLSLG